MGIGIRLKKLLNQQKMTVAELSRKSGVSAQSIYAIIKRDNLTLHPDLAVALSDALNVPVNYLITYDEFKNSATIEIVKCGKKEVLFNHFSKLNQSGQDEAIKRVSELTEIPRYTTPDAPDQEEGE